MDFDAYQKESAKFRNDDLLTRDAVLNAAMGLAGEAGETCDILKKVIFHDHDLDEEKVKLELGDVLFYATWLADLHGFSMLEIAEANVEKLTKRYGDKFSAEKSRNRAE